MNLPGYERSDSYEFSELKTKDGTKVKIEGGALGLTVTMEWYANGLNITFIHSIDNNDFTHTAEQLKQWRQSLGGRSSLSKIEITSVSLHRTLYAEGTVGAFTEAQRTINSVAPLMQMDAITFAKTLDKQLLLIPGVTLTKLVKDIKRNALSWKKEQERKERRGR